MQTIAKVRSVSVVTAERNELLGAGYEHTQLEALLEKTKLSKEVKAVGDKLLRELEGAEARVLVLQRSTKRGD